MYAASPGLHGVEHAIYDVWLTDCKGGTELIVDPKEPEAPVPEEPRRPRNPSRDVIQQPGLPGAGQPVPPAGRIDVQPPQGVPIAPRQAPSQRFFPTNPGATRGAPDPAGSGR
jgi:hypothetical protein